MNIAKCKAHQESRAGDYASWVDLSLISKIWRTVRSGRGKVFYKKICKKAFIMKKIVHAIVIQSIFSIFFQGNGKNLII